MDVTLQQQTLLKRRAALVGELSDIEQALDAPMPRDWEDRSSERQGDEVLEALGQVELAELRRIDAALKRIEQGRYGICVKCEDPISDARLNAVPDAALCKTCAR
ncbi:MAG: TraR/DksA C4-type zinc finger protein [Pseudomonadota bacterium]